MPQNALHLTDWFSALPKWRQRWNGFVYTPRNHRRSNSISCPFTLIFFHIVKIGNTVVFQITRIQNPAFFQGLGFTTPVGQLQYAAVGNRFGNSQLLPIFCIRIKRLGQSVRLNCCQRCCKRTKCRWPPKPPIKISLSFVSFHCRDS